MALELDLKRGKKPQYPVKTTINLAHCNQAPQNLARTVVLFAVAMVAVLLFSKFAVMDVLGAASASVSKAAAAEAQLASLVQGNADYPDLQQRYDEFAVSGLSDEESALVDRGAVLGLLQSTVMQSADLQAVSVSGNSVKLQLVNASLEDVSRVVASLESNSLVASVNVATAKTDKNDDVVSTVTVLLSSADVASASAEAATAKSEG